ncbi:MAG: hypothetical protein PHD67_01355 [Oscillospiraceae bacterium]|nr:hypothetical protein [Oscillospiraceae bacterium]
MEKKAENVEDPNDNIIIEHTFPKVKRKKAKGAGAAGKKTPAQEEKELAQSLLKGAVGPALQLLIDTMNDPEEKNTLRLDCARDILARAYGKAPHALLETSGGGDVQICLTLSKEMRKLAE